MPWWIKAFIGLGAAFALAWLIMLVMLIKMRPGRAALVQAARLLPDLVRLLSRLARDRTLPFGVRARLWMLLVYLASPIDIVPDFLPVIGYADDAIIVVATLRSVVRRAGLEPLRQHWPGSPDGLAVVTRLAGLEQPEAVGVDVSEA